MAKNTIKDLRDHLFAQMERLNDETINSDDMKQEVEKSKAMSLIAKNIIESAKAEVAFMKQSGALEGNADFYGVPTSKQLT